MFQNHYVRAPSKVDSMNCGVFEAWTVVALSSRDAATYGEFLKGTYWMLSGNMSLKLPQFLTNLDYSNFFFSKGLIFSHLPPVNHPPFQKILKIWQNVPSRVRNPLKKTVHDSMFGRGRYDKKNYQKSVFYTGWLDEPVANHPTGCKKFWKFYRMFLEE